MAYSERDSVFLREFGRKVREKRVAKGWSQEELAARCGLDRTYIGALERGERNISLLSLKKISGALEVSLSSIVPQPRG